MQAVPEKWTHNHTHRLFHISLLTTWLFIVGFIALSLFFVLTRAFADSALVNINAEVPEISGGPAVALAPLPPLLPAEPQPPVNQPEELPALSLPPKVEVEIPASAPIETVTVNGKKQDLPVYPTQFPAFSGKTNIKNALIFLEIHSTVIIRGSTYTDDNGNWSWQSPEPISPGAHTLSVTSQDPQLSQIKVVFKVAFFVKLPPGVTLLEPGNNKPLSANPNHSAVLFDVLVRIPSQFKVIPPGEEVAASVKLVNFGASGHPIDLLVQYVIRDKNHNQIMALSETIAVATQISLLKTFTTSPTLAEGTYTLMVTAPSQGVIATASDTFEVKGTAVIPLSLNSRIDFTVIFQILLGLLFLFIIIAYFEYNRVSMLSQVIRQVSDQDLRPLTRTNH